MRIWLVRPAEKGWCVRKKSSEEALIYTSRPIQSHMATRSAVLLAVALFGAAEAFAPAALPMGLRQRSATAKISGYDLHPEIRTRNRLHPVAWARADSALWVDRVRWIGSSHGSRWVGWHCSGWGRQSCYANAHCTLMALVAVVRANVLIQQFTLQSSS